MKLTPWTNVVVASVIALGATTIISQPSQARHEEGFYCDTAGNKPKTVFLNHRGDEELWISWTSDYFKQAGYDPLRRCRDVSNRLERYRQNRQLKFITTGRMNKQNVICTADRSDGECENLILTLKAGEDPVRALKDIFPWYSETGASDDGGDRTTHLDVRDRLGIPKE